MTDELMLHNGRIDDELAWRLEVFASRRLSPAPDTATRIRARVLREADIHLPVASAGTPAWADVAQQAPAHRRHRGPMAALLAASLGVAMLAGGAMASTAGGPLYGLRLWAEAITLPADPGDRAAADLERMESRVGEALAAIGTGNVGGVTAALAAYGEAVDSAIASAGRDDARQADLHAALERHLAVLGGVLEQVPEPAQAAISHALDRAAGAVDRVDRSRGEHRGGGNGGQPGGPGEPPASRPTPGPPDERSPKPTREPRPTASPEPTATPAPAPVATPAPEDPEPTRAASTPKPKPDHTPRADRTEAGGPAAPVEPNARPSKSAGPPR